ncbi:hypothetical protein [Roseateles saccharophilus]|uniref:Uncharacterized protein n=1 Tax=Roseateles saccharophilus TaxID=304 RepID=A0A4R3UKH7_ROSSA|nr:hypothetical protein [Roseateles saccharophilus]MDG0834177.1 hypothetical protein [Roseateles saccharophilus]TCU91302.1 hypothetical protein EV671_102617 [Roseateles saccharophilus]
MPRKTKKSSGETIELSRADLAAIAEARQGIPLPLDLASKLATLVLAALRGQQITINDPGKHLQKVLGEQEPAQ